MCRSKVYLDQELGRSDRLGGGDEIKFPISESENPDEPALAINLSSPLEGFDSRLGYQFLQYSIDLGIQGGYLGGTRFIENGQGGLFRTEKPSPVRVSSIGEPGLKTRTITVDEGWLTMFLSPASHLLSDMLKKFPELRAGLGAAAQGFEFNKFAPRVGKDDVFVTSDMTQASETIDHCLGRSVLKNFFEGAGVSSPYISTAVDTLLSPSTLENLDDGYENLGRVTKRGSLMGRPMTKGLLSLLSLCAFRIMGSKGKTIFCRSAGDDFLMFGNKHSLAGVISLLRDAGQTIPFTSIFTSADMGFLSEEILFTGPERNFGSANPFDPRDYYKHPHCDSVKVRLLSPMGKITLSRDESNPIMGKIQQFAKKISWLPSSLQHNFYAARFKQRFKVFADWNCPFVYLPEEVGGLGFGRIDMPPTSILEKLSPIHMAAIDRVTCGDYSPQILASLWSIRSNTSYRGLESNTAMLLQIRMILGFSGSEISDGQLLEKIQQLQISKCTKEDLPMKYIDQETWSKIRYRHKANMAKDVGYVSIEDVLEQLQRPVYFRNVLYREDQISSAQPEVKALNEIYPDVSQYCENLGVSLDEFTSMDTEFSIRFRKIRADAQQRAREVQMFGSDLLNSKPVPNFMGLISTIPERGFNSKPWAKRIKDSVSNLLFFSPDLKGIEPNLERLTDLINKSKSGQELLSRSGFVPRAILGSSCNLTVDLGEEYVEPQIFEHVEGETPISVTNEKEKLLLRYGVLQS